MPRASFLGGIGQNYTNLAHHQSLFIGHDEEFESAAQPIAITHHGSQLHQMGWERDRKFQGNNFASLQLAAEGCAHPIHAKFAGSAPE